MNLTIKKTMVVEEEVDVRLPLFWKLDNWVHKIEYSDFITIDGNESHKYQLTSVTSNCISRTLMTLDQFAAYYGHYNKLYKRITEQEFVAEFDKLNNYLK